MCGAIVYNYNISSIPPTDPGLVKPSSTADILFLVFHRGSALYSPTDTISKDIDFQTLYDKFTNLLRSIGPWGEWFSG